jgi:hypothetical protein
MLASAVVLAPFDPARASLATLRVLDAGTATLSWGTPERRFAEPLANNPQSGLAALVDAVLRGATGTLALDNGSGRGFAADPGSGRGFATDLGSGRGVTDITPAAR